MLSSVKNNLATTMPRDFAISILRVVFTIWILFYHSINEYFLSTPFDIHSIPELEFTQGVTNVVLSGFMFISGLLITRSYFYRQGKHQSGGATHWTTTP